MFPVLYDGASRPVYRLCLHYRAACRVGLSRLRIHLKRRAPDDAHNQRREPIILRRAPSRTIARTNGIVGVIHSSTERVGQQLLRQRALTYCSGIAHQQSRSSARPSAWCRRDFRESWDSRSVPRYRRAHRPRSRHVADGVKVFERKAHAARRSRWQARADRVRRGALPSAAASSAPSYCRVVLLPPASRHVRRRSPAD